MTHFFPDHHFVTKYSFKDHVQQPANKVVLIGNELWTSWYEAIRDFLLERFLNDKSVASQFPLSAAVKDNQQQPAQSGI